MKKSEIYNWSRLSVKRAIEFCNNGIDTLNELSSVNDNVYIYSAVTNRRINASSLMNSLKTMASELVDCMNQIKDEFTVGLYNYRVIPDIRHVTKLESDINAMKDAYASFFLTH